MQVRRKEMQGTSIRNIKRNKSELIMGQRLNRYGSNHKTGQKSSINNFKCKKGLLRDKFFSINEYLKHNSNINPILRSLTISEEDINIRNTILILSNRAGD